VLIHEVRVDGTPLTQLRRAVIGTLTPDTWPLYLMPIGQPDAVAEAAPRYFSAQITQRNGTSLQDIVVYPKRDGRVELGFLRLTFNGKPYDPDFRLLPQGAAGIIVSLDEIKRVFGLRKLETFIFGGPPK
jgi:hypothetical protein